MTDASPKKRESQKRDQILSSAVRLFNERGFHDTRLEDIANELGKVKTSISYYFHSKEALYKEVFTLACAFTEKELAAAEKQDTGLERIIYLVRRRAALHVDALSGRAPPVMLLSDVKPLADISEPALQIQFEDQIKHVCSFISSGIDDQSIDVRSPEASTFFLMNILHWLPKWLASIPNALHMSAIDGLSDLLRNGIALAPYRPPSRSILRSQSEDYPAIFDRSVRNQLKRDAFLRAGTRFLNQRGFRNLSLNDVANELGVTRGAFYYYIADKDALLKGCFERSCETIEKAMDDAKRSSNLDSLEVIEQTLRILFEGHITDHNPLLNMNLLGAVEPATRIAIEARFKRLRASFSETIANARVDGSARTIDLDALENLLMGSIFAASQWRLAVTPLQSSWKPTLEPMAASAAYFEPLLTGFARKSI